MTKNNEVIAEKSFQKSGVTRCLRTLGRLELTLIVNTSFQLLLLLFLTSVHLNVHLHHLDSTSFAEELDPRGIH